MFWISSFASSGAWLGSREVQSQEPERKRNKNSLRLPQSRVLLHGVEERENDILIPSDKHAHCEQMRKADGFS